MNKPVRSRIKSIVFKTLNNCDKVEFPVNIKYICRNNKDIRLIPYSKQMRKYNLTYTEMIEQAETEDAYTIYDAKKNKYLIFYNDIDTNIVLTNRYRWNIAHELGHVMLEHHKRNKKTKIFRNSLSKQEYSHLEDEADYFASYILVPHSVLYYANPSTAYQLKDICKISSAAAQIRFKEFNIWKSNNIKNMYDSSIRKIFAKYCYQKVCDNCGYSFKTKKTVTYCTICGKKKIKWGGGEMKYRKYEVYEKTNKVKICPKCNNEETDIEGDFCQICGKPLINRCDDRRWNDNSYDEKPCGKQVPSNARYCPYCGSRTTFLNDEVLEEWTVEKREKDERDALEARASQFLNIPDGLDEELPFN